MFSFIVFRICDIGEDSASGNFLKEPDFHTFPLANLHSNRVLRVSVHSLPRCDIFNFTDEILSSKINQLNAWSKHNENENGVDESIRSPLKKKSCTKQPDAKHDVKTLNGNNCASNMDKHRIMDFSKPSTSKTLIDEVVARNCDLNLLNSPKTSSQECCKGGFLKSRSVNEGTPGDLIHEKLNQHYDKKDQTTCNLETQIKQVRILLLT